MEFNKETKTGHLHKITMFMITESKPLRTPSSWHSSAFIKIETVFGESTSLIFMQEERKKFLVMCDVRLNNDSYWFTALHSSEYHADETIHNFKIKRMNKNFQYLACIKTDTNLEMVNYYLHHSMIKAQRISFLLRAELYTVLFIKGFYFLMFSDGSISHINHMYFYNFKLK